MAKYDVRNEYGRKIGEIRAEEDIVDRAIVEGAGKATEAGVAVGFGIVSFIVGGFTKSIRENPGQFRYGGWLVLIGIPVCLALFLLTLLPGAVGRIIGLAILVGAGYGVYKMRSEGGSRTR